MLNHKLDIFCFLSIFTTFTISFFLSVSELTPFDSHPFLTFVIQSIQFSAPFIIIILVIYLVFKYQIKVSGRNYVAVYKMNNKVWTKYGFMEGRITLSNDDPKDKSIKKISIEDMKIKVESKLKDDGATEIKVYTPEEWDEKNDSDNKLKNTLSKRKCMNCGSTEFIQIVDGIQCSYCKTIYK